MTRISTRARKNPNDDNGTSFPINKYPRKLFFLLDCMSEEADTIEKRKIYNMEIVLAFVALHFSKPTPTYTIKNCVWKASFVNVHDLGIHQGNRVFHVCVMILFYL